MAIEQLNPAPAQAPADGPKPIAPTGERDAAEILDLLGRRFRPEVIQTRRIGGGREVAYLPVSAVTERLNKACNTWHFRIVSRSRETMQLTRRNEPRDVPVCVVVGELEIPELGTRQAIGVQAMDDGAGEDLIKGAASDSLKKCASLFGVSVDG